MKIILFILQKIKKRSYISIPKTYSENDKGGLLKIMIDCKNKFYKMNKEYAVNYKYLEIVSEKIWNKLKFDLEYKK